MLTESMYSVEVDMNSLHIDFDDVEKRLLTSNDTVCVKAKTGEYVVSSDTDITIESIINSSQKRHINRFNGTLKADIMDFCSDNYMTLIDNYLYAQPQTNEVFLDIISPTKQHTLTYAQRQSAQPSDLNTVLIPDDTTKDNTDIEYDLW